MASVSFSKDLYIDYMMIMLLDKMMKPKEIMPEHEAWNALVKTMESRGIKQQLMFYFMNTKPEIRSKYKSSRKAFTKGSKESISIYAKGKVDAPSKKKAFKIKDLVKKALKLIKAHKKRTGFPLSEKKIDKILDKLFEEEGVI